MATNVEKILKLINNNKQRIPDDYNGMGETIEPHCQDKMQIYLLVNQRKMIVDCGYTITEDACAPVIACAVAACQLALNKPVMEAYTITKDLIADFITDDGIPNEEHVHCTIMAELTLKRAIIDYVNKHI